MSEKNVHLQKSLTVNQARSFELPKPLEEIHDEELQRKQCISSVMTHVLRYLTEEFTLNEFEWLLPVVFSQSTDPLWPDENASIEKRIEVEIYGKVVRPTASMIVHKLVACSLAYPRLFVLSPNIRIEKRERAITGLHAYEFTQLDFEVRNATSQEVRQFVEKVFCGLLCGLKAKMDDDLFRLRTGHNLPAFSPPFRVYDREELQREFGEGWEFRVTHENSSPFWVVNLPREFYDYEDFQSGRWDNYDLFLPGYGEVLSGARREFEYEKMVGKMEKGGVRKENYGVLLRLAKEGRLKSSAGAGIGLERLVSWIVSAEHVGEVQLFPRIPGTAYEL
jgi:asparaginyl-tRNA synthetase